MAVGQSAHAITQDVAFVIERGETQLRHFYRAYHVIGRTEQTKFSFVVRDELRSTSKKLWCCTRFLT